MPEARRVVLELVFVTVTVVTLFFITIHQMSIGGFLPGNDPAVHLEKTETIIANGRTAYSMIPWYPPLFHTFLAALLLLLGPVDIITASIVLRFVVATINVLLLLSTYLLSRRLLGRGVATASAMFMILSVPLFEMILWGGYANFLGISYIPLIFYIITKDGGGGSVKAFLLFVATFTLVLTHQLATFVFFLIFIPALLIGSASSKRKLLASLAVVLGGGLAVLAWYADVVLRYSNVLVSHLFFEMTEYVYSIPYVSLASLVKVFGAILFLAIAGIPTTFILLKRRKNLSMYPLLLLWLAIPFLLSQSYILGLYLPYERFIYFFAAPMAILAGATVYNLSKLPDFIASRFPSKLAQRLKDLRIAPNLMILVIFFSFQGFLTLQRLDGLPQYYEVLGIAGYDTGEWLKLFYVSDGSVVVSRKPGTWIGVISNHETIEETNPLFGRNEVAEAVLFHFYEMENTRTLTREYTSGDSISGQVMHVSVHNTWTKALSIPDNDIYLNYNDTHGRLTVTSMSEADKSIYWTKKSVNESQLVSQYSHESFTLEKVVTFQSQSPEISLDWRFTAHHDLAHVELKVFSFTEPSLDFREAFLPGVLEWQNPWDNPSSNEGDDWAVVECPPNSLSGNEAAILDAENGVLIAFEFEDFPEWLNVGALANRFIDALRVGYKFGNLTKDESREISFSILSLPLEPGDNERWTRNELKQLLDTETDLPIQESDFLTYIEEYDIEFMVIDAERILWNVQSSPALNRVYDNNRFVILATKCRTFHMEPP